MCIRDRGYILLQYAVELVSYYFTYGRAYSDTAKKRVAYIQKLRRQPLGFFSSKESGELISSFANDFSNVEYTLCYWLPYPIGVGALLAISIVWICLYDWRMGVAMFGMLPVCACLLYTSRSGRLCLRNPRFFVPSPRWSSAPVNLSLIHI